MNIEKEKMTFLGILVNKTTGITYSLGGYKMKIQ